MRFRTTIEQAGKTATGIRVPDNVMAALGSGKRPAVRVTIGSHTYRSTVATVSGAPMVGVSAENRARAGVAGGDVVVVEIELDTERREVNVPPDFVGALARHPAARRMFDGLSFSNQQWHVLSISGAKTDETRQRRIAKSVDALRDGRVR